METELGRREAKIMPYSSKANRFMGNRGTHFHNTEWYDRFMRDHKLNPPISYYKRTRHGILHRAFTRVGQFWFYGLSIGFLWGFGSGIWQTKKRPWRVRYQVAKNKFPGMMFRFGYTWPIFICVETLIEVKFSKLRPYLFGWLIPSQRIGAPILNDTRSESDFNRPFVWGISSALFMIGKRPKWALAISGAAFALPFTYFALRWRHEIFREWRTYRARSEARDTALSTKSRFQLDYKDWRYALNTGGVPRPERRLYEDDLYYENTRPRWFIEMNQVPEDRLKALREGSFARRTFVGPLDNIPKEIKDLMLAEDKRVTATGMPIPKPDRFTRTDQGITQLLLRNKSKFDDPRTDPSIETARHLPPL